MSDEREDLEALVTTDGWQRFKQMVEQQWGGAEGGGARFVSGMTTVAKSTDDALALANMRQIIAAQREIQAVMRWPSEQAERLRKTEMRADSDAVAGSRRGGL